MITAALVGLNALGLLALLWREHKHDGSIAHLMEVAASERMVLISAVQHPEQPTPIYHTTATVKAAAQAQAEAATPMDEYHLVGTINGAGAEQ